MCHNVLYHVLEEVVAGQLIWAENVAIALSRVRMLTPTEKCHSVCR